MSTTRLTRGRSWQRELLSILQAVLLGLVVTAYAGVCSSLSGRAFTTDFVQFFASAQSLRAGGSIYKPLQLEDLGPAPADAGSRPAQVHPNLNPPLLALLVAPLTLLGLQWAYAVWVALSLVSGLCACALLWRGVRQADRKDSELVWLWLAFLVYFPTYTAVTLGQVTTFLFLALAGAWLAARRGRGRLAGVLVGVAVSLKPFVVLLVVFFALQRRWRVVAWSVGTALCAVLVTLPFVGAAAYREYFTVIRSVTWFGNSWNASYSSFITRILGGSENVPLVNAPVFAHGLVLLCSAATLVWLAWLTWPRAATRPVSVEAPFDFAQGGKASTSTTRAASFDLGYGLTLTVMLLVSPLGWMYYFPLLLVPGYTVWSLTRHGSMRPLRRGLLVAWALSTIPTSMVRATDVNDPRGWFTSNSVYFYALCVLAIVVSRALVRVGRGSGVTGSYRTSC